MSKQHKTSDSRMQKRLTKKYPHFKLGDFIRGVRVSKGGRGLTKPKPRRDIKKIRMKMARRSRRINRHKKGKRKMKI